MAEMLCKMTSWALAHIQWEYEVCPYQYTAAPALTCVGCSIGGLVGSAGVQRLGNNAAKKGQGNLCKCWLEHFEVVAT